MKIALTGRRPVSINKADWPVVASADWFSGEHECQANEVAFIRVREHKDGRRIVYGSRDRGPGGMAITYRGAEAGYLLNSDVQAPPSWREREDELSEAVRRVASEIDMPYLAEKCLASLPAEELS